MNISCNIGNNERIARIIIGAVLLIAAILGLGKIFMFLVAVILIAEGFLGWCGVPILVEKFKLQNLFKDKQQP